MIRLLTSAVIGLVVAGAALVACSSLDPTPPNPHFIDDPDPLTPAILDAHDAGHDAPEEAP